MQIAIYDAVFLVGDLHALSLFDKTAGAVPGSTVFPASGHTSSNTYRIVTGQCSEVAANVISRVLGVLGSV